MKVFKGKIWAALGSLMDHAAAATASGNTKASSAAAPDRALLADIEAAVERCTGGAGGGGGRGGGGGGGGGDHDDRHVHEILFLVSNAPGAITFLSRRITARLEAARAPAAALRQRLLDLAIQLLPDNNTSAASAAARSAFGIVLRESFKVYDAFKDGLDALLRSRAAGAMASKASRASAHEILKKACAQTPELKEFYHKCKRSNVSKSLDYPVVRVVTSAMELIMPPVDEEADADDRCCGEEEAPGGDDDDGVSAGGAPFATKLETTISTVWVEFDDGDDGLQHDAAAAGGGGDHSLQPTYSL
uniref:AP180 N-terminal homology (ANTH) domain-containing protein n=1 Tax=Oryza brachyantha TaxID=4533 RepID=J3N757_ORYBR